MNPIYNMRSNYSNKGLIDLVDFISNKKSKDLIMIEIGSYQGQSMETFANTGKIKTIICIDPWQQGYDINDKASDTDMVEVERLFDERVSKIDNVQIIKHKGTLDTFIKSEEFEQIKNSIDFVYIDACHTYQAVKHDIKICKEIIKPNIAFAGHDFRDYWAGVKKAIKEEFNEPDKVFLDSSWVKFV